VIGTPRNCLRMSEATAFGRAGCGKSARPVLRGGRDFLPYSTGDFFLKLTALEPNRVREY